MNVAIESRQSLVDRIGQLAPELRALGVARLSVFGSFARNAARDDSDIDLLVEFLPGRKTFDNFSSVYDLLEDKHVAVQIWNASDRDGIAREYETGFAVTFERGAPTLARARTDVSRAS